MTVGTRSGEPSPGCEGVLSGRDAWYPIRNEHEVPPYQNGTRLQLRDCDDDMQTGYEVPWPGLDVLDFFSNAGQDLGRLFPDSAGIMIPPRSTIHWTCDPGVGVNYIRLGFMNMVPGNATAPGVFALTSGNFASQQFSKSTSGFEPLSNDIGSISFYTATLSGLLSVTDDIAGVYQTVSIVVLGDYRACMPSYWEVRHSEFGLRVSGQAR